MTARRRFGSVRRLPSNRCQARYLDGDGERITAPDTFTTKAEAHRWLAAVETDIARGDWHDPRLGERTLSDWAQRVAGDEATKPRRFNGLALRVSAPASGRAAFRRLAHRSHPTERCAGLARHLARHRSQPEHGRQGVPTSQRRNGWRSQCGPDSEDAVHVEGREHRAHVGDEGRHAGAGCRPRCRSWTAMGSARPHGRVQRAALGRARRSSSVRRQSRHQMRSASDGSSPRSTARCRSAHPRHRPACAPLASRASSPVRSRCTSTSTRSQATTASSFRAPRADRCGAPTSVSACGNRRRRRSA